MAYPSSVYRVLIASPSDLEVERRLARERVYAWNDRHSWYLSTVLLPVMWESHAMPELGSRPQGIINRQIVADADILVAMFWTKLGTPTGHANSGTVEEIQEFLRAGKHVLLYFSSVPITPSSIDQYQYAKLAEYRDEVRKLGLVSSFETSEQFADLLDRHLLAAVLRSRTLHGSPGTDLHTAHDQQLAVFKAQVEQLAHYASLRWPTVDDYTLGVEAAKDLLQDILYQLHGLRTSPALERSPTLAGWLNDVMAETKELRRHRLYVDDGMSRRAFWIRFELLLHNIRGSSVSDEHFRPD
jgi:hypothetical protein